MTPPPYLLFDFETRSLCKIKLGGRVYSRHPSTEVLCVTFAEADSRSGEWDFHTVWRPREYPFGDERVEVAVAHNCIGFDRHVWVNTLGWPEPKRWLDSAILARRAGFAESSLEAVGEQYGHAKDMQGSALTKRLSIKSRKPGRTFQTQITCEIAERVMAYCEQDVRVMAAIVDDLALEFDFALAEPGTWQAQEHAVYMAHLALLDRGIAFDARYARNLIAQERLAAEDACAEAGVTPAQVKSVPQFRALAKSQGIDVPNAKRETLEPFADEPLVAARLACTSITAGKLLAGLQREIDGRLRDTSKYYGAHTGRWSGQGMQTQNLPRGAKICLHEPAVKGCTECQEIVYKVLSA